jgi:2-polyprenyl-3-methyl-5-hydroxy-6-metoxy-1,4-benzoquinol methylase
MSASQHVPPAPAVLQLVQTVVLGRWRASGEDLYREVVQLTELGAGQEALVSGSGDGFTCEWLAAKTGAAVTGVDADAEQVENAEARARALIRPLPVAYQQAPLDDLPHETAVFDVAIGEPVLAAAADPARAVAELARVTKPMGSVILLQLTWSSELQGQARELLVERLGLRPRLLVEWKQMMRDAGIVDLQVQDWTDSAPQPEADAGPQLTWRQKMQILGSAWRRWGWKEARDALEREESLLRELSRERSIGFQLIKGVKWPHARST